MRNQFMYDLYCYYMENMTIPEDLEVQRAMDTLIRLEAKFAKTMGMKFVQEYEEAEFQARAWQEEAAFLAGCRLGANLMLAALPYPSSSTSAPNRFSPSRMSDQE